MPSSVSNDRCLQRHLQRLHGESHGCHCGVERTTPALDRPAVAIASVELMRRSLLKSAGSASIPAETGTHLDRPEILQLGYRDELDRLGRRERCCATSTLRVRAASFRRGDTILGKEELLGKVRPWIERPFGECAASAGSIREVPELDFRASGSPAYRRDTQHRSLSARLAGATEQTHDVTIERSPDARSRFGVPERPNRRINASARRSLPGRC